VLENAGTTHERQRVEISFADFVRRERSVNAAAEFARERAAASARDRALRSERFRFVTGIEKLFVPKPAGRYEKQDSSCHRDHPPYEEREKERKKERGPRVALGYFAVQRGARKPNANARSRLQANA
jgi:hypothetical protein